MEEVAAVDSLVEGVLTDIVEEETGQHFAGDWEAVGFENLVGSLQEVVHC